jgi:hypothetical protein
MTGLFGSGRVVPRLNGFRVTVMVLKLSHGAPRLFDLPVHPEIIQFAFGIWLVTDREASCRYSLAI